MSTPKSAIATKDHWATMSTRITSSNARKHRKKNWATKSTSLAQMQQTGTTNNTTTTIITPITTTTTTVVAVVVGLFVFCLARPAPGLCCGRIFSVHATSGTPRFAIATTNDRPAASISFISRGLKQQQITNWATKSTIFGPVIKAANTNRPAATTITTLTTTITTVVPVVVGLFIFCLARPAPSLFCGRFCLSTQQRATNDWLDMKTGT